jgi:hypothetical protein
MSQIGYNYEEILSIVMKHDLDRLGEENCILKAKYMYRDLRKGWVANISCRDMELFKGLIKADRLGSEFVVRHNSDNKSFVFRCYGDKYMKYIKVLYTYKSKTTLYIVSDTNKHTPGFFIGEYTTVKYDDFEEKVIPWYKWYKQFNKREEDNTISPPKEFAEDLSEHILTNYTHLRSSKHDSNDDNSEEKVKIASDNELADMLDSEGIDPSCFRIGSRIDKGEYTIINLETLKPYYCPICDKKHEKENPYITVGNTGRHYYKCRRDNGETKLQIGNTGKSRRDRNYKNHDEMSSSSSSRSIKSEKKKKRSGKTKAAEKSISKIVRVKVDKESKKGASDEANKLRNLKRNFN